MVNLHQSMTLKSLRKKLKRSCLITAMTDALLKHPMVVFVVGN